ncbi:condensation domain-containing protein [Prosthecobacter sp.]|uniref:condensation domain-containing protein n=1 Tax=Prosthecobacter sp. TaxID=1965333 RepID=UPI002AB9FFBB|nr:condensation domain-containing protein [Prosthecobacter sp.]MDZ4405948.1 condensation domain-containing protein [Prosthecobacter sp.]
MSQDNRTRLKQRLESGEIRLKPLTLPQRELWETSPVPAGDVSNHICAFIQVRGLLTPQGCEAALQKVVDRQEVFRLSFLPGKDQPMQLIRKTGKVLLPFRDLTPSQQQPEALEELSQEIFSKPFDLVGGPLYRAEVLRRAADDHVLVVAIHHAIADGWTLGVFVQDLFAAYVQGLRGLHDALPPVPLSYSDWGATERAYWQPAELEPRATFWKSRLAATKPLWSPPTGPQVASGERRRWVAHIPADVGRAVRELARRNGATLFSTLLAAFQITLSKWTGSDDILVGTPVANRNKQAVRETMGYCAGIVPLRGQIDRTRSFSERLQEVQQATVESFANAMPFAELVRALGIATSPGHNPVFQVRFALQNHPVPDISVNGVSLQLRMRSTGTCRFDLACEITEEGDSLEMVWLFRRDLFPLDDIQNLNRLYLAVLTGVCRSPEILTAALMTTL